MCAVAWRSDFASSYSSEAHHAFACETEGNSKIIKRLGDHVPSRVSEAPPRASCRRGSLKIVLRILSYLKPYWRRVTCAYLALFTAVGLQLYIPHVLAGVIDRHKHR